MKRNTSNAAQILLFPSGAEVQGLDGLKMTEGVAPRTFSVLAPSSPLAVYSVVLSGTFRKDPNRLRLEFEELRDLGCKILSPRNVNVTSEVDGFVYMKGEEDKTAESIESGHLDAIQRASFVWLHAPEGYVGPSAALEVGFARAVGVPVYARNGVNDAVLREFVRVVNTPAEVPANLLSNKLAIPQPALDAFQNYYRRVAIERGYHRESARDCLLLMVEEVGELARAIRKREKLKRHGSEIQQDEASELADVFLYVVHMANVFGISLSKAVQDKELSNTLRFLSASTR